MEKHYQLDLSRYSLQKFKNNLASRDMIPSRVSLKDELDEHFNILEDNEITNLKGLIDRLNTKQKIELFSQETGLSIEYLTLLKREANSYRQNPIRLDKFPGIPRKHVNRLDAKGIRNSRKLFYEANDKNEREKLAKKTGIPVEIMDELVCLSDLVRAYGVGPVFARIFYDVGIKTIEDFVELTAEDIVRIYEEKEQKKADFGVNEIQFSLELARELEITVEI